ncbi:hypothetical protein [Flavobacterium gawalongense]|uniref:Major outer membrane protein n=1 Tax=Flavobacterium gawalongense TaxID=2594432 RepID=A0ABY3CSA7_9FLAO|nr:hypothetical protein [Flavobacterium gawalongense]TRX01899.1 hypothetical protein FNW33_08370 [Flavobacterium gawalongense]TRX06353.1 hypothetical protein FNW12_08905 [Flavobacterium gawalongense]
MKNLSFLHSAFIFILFLTIAFNTQNITAQGCVAVRQMGGQNMNSSNSYNLSEGEFQVGANYRYFHSWRHFVGTEEQLHRQTTNGGHDANGKERGNAVNIYSHAVDLNISYGLTNRIQLNATLPYVNNERSQVLRQKTPVIDTLRYSVYADGIADARLSVNYWVVDPKKAEKGNVMIGLGVKLNNGSHDEMDDAPQADGTTKSVVMDQAIQPGDGGVGFSVELQAFRQLTGRLYGFANGYYLFNPRESNGTFKSAPKAGLEGYEIYASPDQYFGRAGFMAAVDKKENFTVSLAGRFEGIPAYDAFGGQVAYRRPGYVIAVEYGLSYRLGKHGFSLYIPYNVVKNRIQSAADLASQDLQNSVITDPSKYVHVQGDAAFADYSINVGYSYRFNLNKKMTMTMKH